MFSECFLKYHMACVLKILLFTSITFLLLSPMHKSWQGTLGRFLLILFKSQYDYHTHKFNFDITIFLSYNLSPFFPITFLIDFVSIQDPMKDHALHLIVILLLPFITLAFVKSSYQLSYRMSHNPGLRDESFVIKFNLSIFDKNYIGDATFSTGP